MFEFFKKKRTPPRLQEITPSPLPELSESQKDSITKTLEGYGSSEQGDLEAVIGMVNLGMNEFLPGFFSELTKASLYVALTDLNDLNSVLVLHQKDCPPHLATFTDPKHASLLSSKFPEHRYAALMSVRTICEGIKGELGLIINPIHDTFCFSFNPVQLAAFKAILKEED